MTSFESFCYTFKGFVGIAILSVPLALQQTGMVAGLIVLLVVSLFNAYANHLIIEARARTPEANTYLEMTYIYFTPKVAITVEVLFVSSKILIGTAFLRYFGEQVDLILCNTQVYCGYEAYYSFMGMVFIVLIAFVRSYKQIAPISIIATISVVFAITAVIIDSVYTIHNTGTQTFPLSNWATYGYCFGKINISAENVAMMPGIYSATRNKSTYGPLHLSAFALHTL